jgi:hypothetical protein
MHCCREIRLPLRLSVTSRQGASRKGVKDASQFVVRPIRECFEERLPSNLYAFLALAQSILALDTEGCNP